MVEDVELERGVTKEGLAKQSMGEWRVLGARSRGSRWKPRVQPGRSPMVESRKGAAVVEISSSKTWARRMEMELMDGEPRAQTESRCIKNGAVATTPRGGGGAGATEDQDGPERGEEKERSGWLANLWHMQGNV